MSSWDNLSMAEKAEMMKVAVRQGITNLSDIKQRYNEFAEGGSKEEEEEVNTIVPFTQRREVIITPDTEYNQYLNTLPDNQRFTPNDKYDSYFYWKLNGRPRNFEEAYNKGMFHYDHSDNGYHANSIAFDDNTGVGYFMKPKTHDTVGYELDWFNKGLVTEEGGKQRPVTPEEAKELEEFRKNYVLTNDPDRPNYYRYQPIEKAEGGSIHIKPSHRGRLTALKERTGKTEAELYNDGNPAHKKMVVFARNSRKWKHGLGGWLESLATTASKKVMDYIQAFPANPFTYDWQNANGDGTAQDTYLLPRKLQEKEFLRKGYIKGKDKDYGLVKKAVGDRNLPVYQTAPDAITRDKLILLGNDGYYVAEHDLEHPGSHPLATYTDGHGNFYQKAWDLNDYGGEGGSTESIAGKLLDMVGSPVVVTTGYQKIKDHPWQVGALKGMMAKKGLVPTEIDGKTEWTLPEITVTGKKRRK